MTARKELDLRVAYTDLALALEEIIFCTVHAALAGAHRREIALKTFAGACVKIEKIREEKE